jgi:hypothetical protein
VLAYARKFYRLPPTESSSLPLLRISIDGVILIWIGWFAWRHAGFFLRDDLYLYGDHPGQFYRLWQMLAVAWPEEGKLISWGSHWHAGWPELQFYPPGLFLLGWLLWMGSFQQLSLFRVYQILVFLAFIVPAINFYLLMAWGVGDRLAGLATAWLAMIFPFPLGGVQSVIIGMLGYQLAFGLSPLLILSGLWLMRTERKALAWFITGLLLGAIILLHPYQALFPMGVLGLYALFRGQDWQRCFCWLAWIVLLGLGLTAFWWLPLGARSQFFVAGIEGGLLDIRTHLENEFTWLAGTGWLLAAALAGAFFQARHRRSLSLAVLGGGAGLLGFILFDYLILVERLHLFILDPVRLIPGVTFALLVGLALGVSELAWFGPRLLARWGWEIVGLPLILLVSWWGYSQVVAEFDFAKWMRKYQAAPDRTPIFLQEAEAKYGLPEVWEMMAATPGRILFTSHYGLLFDVPTTLKAVTPVLTGREIVGGTFSLRSPVASYMWTGNREPLVLRGKVEAADDKALAGVAWEEMTDDVLFDLVRRFNATLIVTTATDVQARAFLEASPRFEPVWSNELLTLYNVVNYTPRWVEAKQATVRLSRYERTALDITVIEAEPEASLFIKRANYPLWRAKVDDRYLPVQTDSYGLMTLALPPGSYIVSLRYGPAWPERLGQLMSLVTVVGAIGWGFYYHKQAHNYRQSANSYDLFSPKNII